MKILESYAYVEKKQKGLASYIAIASYIVLLQQFLNINILIQHYNQLHKTQVLLLKFMMMILMHRCYDCICLLEGMAIYHWVN